MTLGCQTVRHAVGFVRLRIGRRVRARSSAAVPAPQTHYSATTMHTPRDRLRDTSHSNAAKPPTSPPLARKSRNARHLQTRASTASTAQTRASPSASPSLHHAANAPPQTHSSCYILHSSTPNHDAPAPVPRVLAQAPPSRRLVQPLASRARLRHPTNSTHSSTPPVAYAPSNATHTPSSSSLSLLSATTHYPHRTPARSPRRAPTPPPTRPHLSTPCRYKSTPATRYRRQCDDECNHETRFHCLPRPRRRRRRFQCAP
mmetsp:Transcript_7413/g.27066  ORF Transcript_7413/g.27066 Transcript_7413/m.27066 type:complete len:259 (-) Transcript_7413:121-897(-)